jgi:hypothetical protein
MRSTTILLILVCALSHVSLTLHAQRILDLGIKGGVNLDDLVSSYTHSPIIGGNFGLFDRVKPALLPGVQGAILLSSMGISTQVLGVNAELRSMDLQLPLFAVFALGPFELHRGGYYSHHFARRLINDLEMDIDLNEAGIEDIHDDTFGLLVGAGLRLSDPTQVPVTYRGSMPMALDRTWAK